MKPAIIGIPYDEQSSFMRGAAMAPPEIRRAYHSAASNYWSESGIEVGPGLLYDAGDLEALSGSGMRESIESAIGGLLDGGYAPISLGGDHSITHPIIAGFSRRYERLSILHIDAHPDLYDEFEGNRHSHACPFARIMEAGLVERLVQVGIRTMSDHQREQAARFGVEVIGMRDFRDELKIHFDTPVYISFDIDGLDPAFAPGVSHREPGGMSARQALNLIESIAAPIAGADIVEFNPLQDPGGLTAFVCARILKEIAAKIVGSTGTAA